jgi:hypothetical protein
VFVRWRSPFGKSQFARRQRVSVGQTKPLVLFFASPEDTILAKLEWYRDGGHVSDRQWRDLLGVLKVQTTRLDRAYLARWAGELGVADLLQRAFLEAGLAEP